MKTKIISDKHRETAQKKFQDFINTNEILVVNISFFADNVREEYKAVICYYK